jgi:hypothetical protein
MGSNPIGDANKQDGLRNTHPEATRCGADQKGVFLGGFGSPLLPRPRLQKNKPFWLSRLGSTINHLVNSKRNPK